MFKFFSNIINYFKARKPARNNIVYEVISRVYGHKRKSATGYSAIATHAYKKNFITFRCIEEIIRAATQINYKVFRGDPGEEIKNHEAVQVLNKPNDLYGRSELLLRAILFYYIGGEAPFQLMKNTFRSKLFTYRPDRISKEVTGDPFIPYKNITYDVSGIAAIPPEEFFLVKKYDPVDMLDGLGPGMSSLEPLLRIVDQQNTMKDWNISLLENGGSLSGIVSVPDILGDDEYKRAQAELKQRHQGAGNVGKFLLLEGGASFHATSQTSKEADWILGEKMTVQQICSGLGVDPIVVGFNEYSSYNNKQEAEKALYRNTAIPLLSQFVDSFNVHFRKAGILAENEEIRQDYSHIPVLQQDLKELSEKLKNMDFLTINQKRKIAGDEELPGCDVIVGQNFIIGKDGTLYAPLNLSPLGEPRALDQAAKKNFFY